MDSFCARAAITRALSIVTLLVSVSVAAAQTEPVCKQTDARPRAGSASVAQSAGESLQNKKWQPIGGLVEITVNNFKPADANAAVVTTCFRWKVAKDGAAKFVESVPTRVDLSNGALKVTVVVPDLPDLDENQTVARRVWVVPLAEVRVIAPKAGPGGSDIDAWTEIGITYPWISLLLAVAVIVLAMVALDTVVKRRVKHEGIRKANPLLRVISTPYAVASLSQLQILLWTLVIAGSAIYVASLSGQLVEVTTGALVLLGISGAATLAAQAHNENQIAAKQADAEKNEKPRVPPDQAAAEADKAEAAAATAKAAADTASAQAQAALQAAAADASLQTAADEAKKKADAAQQSASDAAKAAKAAQDWADEVEASKTRTPQWSDLIVSETKGFNGVREIDVARVQMLLFTLISAVFVTVKVIAAYVIPEIPVGYLTLMGISNGVYVGSKVVRNS